MTTLVTIKHLAADVHRLRNPMAVGPRLAKIPYQAQKVVERSGYARSPLI